MLIQLKLQLYIFVLLCHLLTNTIACPKRSALAPCTCHDLTKGLEITCEGVWPRENLKKIFNNLQTNSIENSTPMYLKLKDTDLSLLPKELFSMLEIRHLMAHKCSIEFIDINTFTSLKNHIESIDLSENLLLKVPDALQNLTSLLSLNLNFNKIETLHSDAFQGLNSLVRLSLFGNKIRFIHSSSFHGTVDNLTRINLGGNQLKSIPTVSLRPLRSLQRLQVHDNQIETLEMDSFLNFESASSLDTINLAHNKLQTLGAKLFVQLSNLSSLAFEGNRISKIDSQAFFGVERSLEWLKLGDNQLKHIPAISLMNLAVLRELDLRDNLIQIIHNNDFSVYGESIKFLYLQKNQISTINQYAFEPLKSLEWLNLSGNRLITLSERTLETLLNNLLIFDISDNPLLCSCSVLWLDRAASTLNGRNRAAQNNIATMEAVKCYHKNDEMKNQSFSSSPSSSPFSSSSPSSSPSSSYSAQLQLNIVAKHLECSSSTRINIKEFKHLTIILFVVFVFVLSF